MQTKKPPLERMAFENTQRNNYTTKKFPPFGKQLDELRRKGLIPAKRVIVATDWSIGKIFPRIIVTPDAPVANLRFNYLVSLHVQIVHYDHDSQILESLITEILSIQPESLSAFNMSAVKRGEPAFKMIFSKSIMEVAA
jgi:hypothetical protein